MYTNTDKVIFEGLEVTKDYYSKEEPFITHGLFHVRNRTNAVIGFSVRQVSCLAGSESIKIPGYYLYKLPDYQEIEQAEIMLNRDESVHLEISFPGISAAPFLHENVCVELQIFFENRLKSIRSPIRIRIRTKKDQLAK